MKQPVISEAAESDLSEIWSYIAKDNPGAADRFLALLYEKCRSLAEAPGIGPERPELGDALRGFPVGNYVIFYKPEPSGVEIVRVISGHRDIPSLFLN